MVVLLTRGIAALITLQSLHGIWLAWYYNLPQLWLVGMLIGGGLQCALAWRLWHGKRWSVVLIALGSGMGAVISGKIPEGGIGWQLYYTLIAIILTIIATQEWKQLKSGL